MDKKQELEQLLSQWDKPDYKYFIAEPKENPKDTLILKTGLTSKFSLNDVLRDMEAIKKRKIELEAQIDLEKAKIDNVKSHYPEVEQTDEKIRIAHSIYQISTESIKRFNEQLKSVNDVLDEEAKQIDEIAKQTGITIEPKKEDGK
mgnify:CR=1 FL=1